VKNGAEFERIHEHNPLVELVILPNYMYKGSGRIIKRWDSLIIILSIYNAFTIPLDLSFQPAFFKNDFLQIFDSTVDLIFIVDICLMFRTTYIDAHLGIEIVDPIEIARKYVSGRFAIDLLSTIPLNAIFHATVLAEDNH